MRLIIVVNEQGIVENVYTNTDEEIDIDVIDLSRYDDYSKGDYEEECDDLGLEVEINNYKYHRV